MWIPVGEGLPADGVPVLVAFSNGARRIAALFRETPGYEDNVEAYQYWDNPDDGGQCWEWGEVTHWAELPAPPKAT